MDRLLNMILNMVLRRGLRAMTSGGGKTRRRPGRGGEAAAEPDPATAQDAAARETQKRMRETQRLQRRLGR